MSRRNGTAGGAATAGEVFGKLLAELRDAAGLTQAKLAALIPADRTRVTRIEAGNYVPSLDVAQACDRILETGGVLAALWHQIDWYPAIQYPDWFQRRAEMDAVAEAVHLYHVGIIPGLLQTADYARTLLARTNSPDELPERVLARLNRQGRYLEPDETETPPLLVAVLDESAVRRVVGSPAIMRGQLQRLLAVGMMPNVRIQVAPFSAATLALPNTSMTLLTLPGGHPDGTEWIYSESLERGDLSDDPAIIRRYRRSYDLLRADALSARESAALISEVVRGLDHDAPRFQQGELSQGQGIRRQQRGLRGSGPRIWVRPGARA